MRFETERGLTGDEMISKSMPFFPFHHQAEMERGNLAPVHAPSIGNIRHVVNEVRYNLMPVEIQVDRPIGSPADSAPHGVHIEAFSRLQINHWKGEVKWAHDYASPIKFTDLSMKGACGGTRTPGLRITNPMHYQLCYTGDVQPKR